jgi:hypothetical protein
MMRTGFDVTMQDWQACATLGLQPTFVERIVGTPVPGMEGTETSAKT